MFCILCHLPFQSGEVVYDMKCDDGTFNHFHIACFYETRQGLMGYTPSREFVFGREATYYVDLFISRNKPI